MSHERFMNENEHLSYHVALQDTGKALQHHTSGYPEADYAPAVLASAG